MKVKNFHDYLDQRLNKKEIANIEKAAKIEFESLKRLKKDISQAVSDYMKKNKIGFNELARLLGKSPSQLSKIIKGEANLTLASVAQIYAMMGYKAHILAA